MISSKDMYDNHKKMAFWKEKLKKGAKNRKWAVNFTLRKNYGKQPAQAWNLNWFGVLKSTTRIYKKNS